jgi:hypothetical protein
VHYDNEPTLADLHLSLLERFNVHIDKLGGSTAPLTV